MEREGTVRKKKQQQRGVSSKCNISSTLKRQHDVITILRRSCIPLFTREESKYMSYMVCKNLIQSVMTQGKECQNGVDLLPFVRSLRIPGKCLNEELSRLLIPHKMKRSSDLLSTPNVLHSQLCCYSQYNLAPLLQAQSPDSSFCNLHVSTAGCGGRTVWKKLSVRQDSRLHIDYNHNTGNVVLGLWLESRDVDNSYESLLYLVLYGLILQRCCRIHKTRNIFIDYVYIASSPQYRGGEHVTHLRTFSYSPRTVLAHSNHHYCAVRSRMRDSVENSREWSLYSKPLEDQILIAAKRQLPPHPPPLPV